MGITIIRIRKFKIEHTIYETQLSTYTTVYGHMELLHVYHHCVLNTTFRSTTQFTSVSN